MIGKNHIGSHIYQPSIGLGRILISKLVIMAAIKCTP